MTASYSWLLHVPELFSVRAPGNTCLSALRSPSGGTLEEPINHSKGCGGIMRVAPVGLYFETGKSGKYTIEQIDRIGAETAALTHGHELGYLPAAALTHILQRLSHDEISSLAEAVEDMKEHITGQFAGTSHLDQLIDRIDQAVILSWKDIDDLTAIHRLGEGWVAEETLAIGLYCALKYEEDFDRALISAVNHGGDSDSTGAITGNLLGARLGLQGIPEKYLRNLELKDVILEIADDLYFGCRISEYGSVEDEIWEQKYVYHTYTPVRSR